MHRKFLSLIISLALVAGPAFGDVDRPVIRYAALDHPIYGPAGMVASQSRFATEVGADILSEGGNAVDAAVAVGFTLAVTLPRAGNVGGGGFMLIHDMDKGETTAIDYRESAPPRATRNMYLDAEGNVDNQLARFSHLSAGVPGTVAGLWEAHQAYGRLEWSRLLQPAIDLARNGFPMGYDMSEALARRQDRLCANEAACGYFYQADGTPWEPLEVFVQDDLADTLERIAENGRDGFYKGKTARLIAEDMARHGGLIDEAALANYEPTWREPVIGTYRGNAIVTFPPPSSGGVHVIQMLNILENFDVKGEGFGSAANIHLLAEAMRLAYADRSKHLGDPDYYPVPVEWLTSKA